MKIKWMMMTAAMAATAAASAAILTSDDFSGETLKAQWRAAPAGANSPVIVADGSVSTTVQAPDGKDIVTAVLSTTGYVLPAGDFAVQIDESKTWSGGYYQNCFFQVGIGSNAYLLGKFWIDQYTANVYTNGFPDKMWDAKAVNMNFNTMGFKIARVGTTLTYSARGWNTVNSTWTTWTTIDTATVAAGDATVAFGVQNSENTSLGTNWDNFVVVPEPAALALLGLGALGLIRRRRT